jgi:N-carbamoylputrescine amidase
MNAPTRHLECALIQQAWTGDADSMFAATCQQIRKAAADGAQLIVLQELHRGPYFCQVQDPDLHHLAEPIPGPSTQLLGALAAELQVVIVASLFERRGPGISANTAAVLDSDGSLVGIYRKMHIPQDPGFEEKFYFIPGDLGFTPIDTSFGKLGVLVCWDQWYPEAARLMAMAGAELLIYPTAIGWDPRDDDAEQQRQLEAWVTVQRGHAVANGLPVLVANRCGREADPSTASDGIEFWGNSFVAGPQGEFLARAGADAEEILRCRIDLSRSEDVRRIWPFLRDRRIDAYGDLTRRWLEDRC